MAIPRKRPAFLLCLILSTLGPPCSAMRSGTAELGSESDEWKNKPNCAGMRLNKTSKLCFYDYEHPKDSLEEFSMNWSTQGSDAPLIFAAHHGVYQIQSQFIAELAHAAGDKEVRTIIASDVARLEMLRNASFEKHFINWQHRFHTVEEDFKPGFFLLEHSVEHAIFEGLAIGFHALEHAAHTGIIVGEEAALATMEATFGVIGGTFGVIAHYILPVLLIPQSIYMIWRIHKHFKTSTHHTKDFVKRLVFKSDCMEAKTKIKKEYVLDHPGFLKDSVKEVCGNNTENMLAMQMQRTNYAMEKIFTTLESLGRCLWPHNKRRWAKIDCAENLYWKLRQHENGPGIVFAALSLAATYAAEADELFDEPFYGDHFEEEFGIGVPANTSNSFPRISEIADASVAVRASVCIQLVATHRAFELTFLRLETAIRVYLQSFGRKGVVPNIRSSWKPCEKVFFKLEDIGQGFCKHEDWHNGHGEDEHDMALDEPSSCNESKDNRTSLWPEEEEDREKKQLKEEKKLQKQQEKEARKEAKKGGKNGNKVLGITAANGKDGVKGPMPATV